MSSYTECKLVTFLCCCTPKIIFFFSLDVKLIPSRSWAMGATTSSSATPSLLGLSLRLCDPKHALEQVRLISFPFEYYSTLLILLLQ